MITLKLTAYSQQESNLLAEVLESTQKQLHTYCALNNDCKTCPIRHLCLDIAQATLYAEEYKAVRN